MIVGKSENDRPVAPGPPANKVSPVNTMPSSGTEKQTAPGLWPGVCSTWTPTPATVRTWPPCNSAPGCEELCVIPHSAASAGCSQTVAPVRLASVRGGVDVVVVPVGEQDGLHPPTADLLQDRVGVMGGVDDHHFVVVAEQPDVVLERPSSRRRA